MKNIILIFIILTFFSNLLSADSINEYKTDIYFGNGVWNSNKQAEESRRYLETWIIKREIIKNNPKLMKKYGKVKLVYNWGQGTMTDALETFYQLKEAGQVNDLQFFGVIYALTKGNIPASLTATVAKKLYEPLNRNWEQGNVDEMWQKYYNESFKLSHRVLLVSHSQGNLFANRIYDNINPTDYQRYFANLQVASPANEVKATKGDYVTLFGDPIINPIPGSMTANASGDSGHGFIEAYLSQNDPLQKIINKLKALLPTIESEVSQWVKDTVRNEGTENYRATLKHSFDLGVEVNEEVLPFNLAGYLYQVKDTAGIPHYVKASFGGERILNDTEWEAEDNQFYKLQGTDPVEYIEGEDSCKEPSNFEVVSQQNENTADWRVTVKNKETDEITEGVYPFNLNGSLYQIERGEWVLANCGGTEILSVWDGQKENEFFKLAGTDEVIKDKKIGECNNTPYKPDHFEISWDFAIEDGNRKFVYYHNNPQEQGARLGFNIYAVDKDGYLFTGIDNNCHPEDVNITVTFDIFGEKSLNSVIQEKDNNVSLTPFTSLQDSDNRYSFLIKTEDFVQGNVIKEYKINFERVTNIVKNPLKFTIKDINISFAGLIGGNSDDKSATFVYARAHNTDHTFQKGVSPVYAKIYYEAYCKGYNRRVDFGLNGNESIDSVNWSILEGDYNLDYSNPTGNNGAIVNRANSSQIEIIPAQTPPYRIYYVPKKYLLYDKYNSNISRHYFRVSFR